MCVFPTRNLSTQISSYALRYSIWRSHASIAFSCHSRVLAHSWRTGSSGNPPDDTLYSCGLHSRALHSAIHSRPWAQSPLLGLRLARTASLSRFFPVMFRYSYAYNSKSLHACRLQLAMTFTMPIAAAFCESEWGWPGVYYLQGAITLLLTVVFFAFFRNRAGEHWLGIYVLSQ